jgi:sulfur carrier protein
LWFCAELGSIAPAAYERSKDQSVTAEAKVSIKVLINGEPRVTAAVTLAELVAEQGLAGVRVATARNGDFVPERARGETALRSGDRIEIVTPRHGG